MADLVITLVEGSSPNVDNFKALVLFGYFQSPKFFDNQKQQIFSMIGIPEIKDKILKEFPQYFDGDGIKICMHFRMGDYKNHPDYHPILTYEYYYNALMHMIMHSVLTSKITVLYFCEKDDNKDVQAIINRLKNDFENFHFVKVDDKIEDWKQMMIMSNCDHNIIANSSFSWWGAYFNMNKDEYNERRVLYPETWFGPTANIDTKDLCPPDWVKINYNY